MFIQVYNIQDSYIHLSHMFMSVYVKIYKNMQVYTILF